MSSNLSILPSQSPTASITAVPLPVPNTSLSSAAPCKAFMPFGTPTDLLLRELYLQNITDEFGNLINIPQVSLPELNNDEIEALRGLLNGTIHVTDRASQADIEVKIIDLLRDVSNRIQERHQTTLDDCELIGSTVSLILGIAYMKRAFTELGLKNVDEVITPQLFKDIQRKVPDYDIRFNVSKADKDKLGQFTLEVISSIASLKAFDHKSYYEWCSYIRTNMLNKFKALSCPQTDYSIISTGDHKNAGLEILFVKNLPRLHLFRRDAIRIVLTKLLSNKDKTIPKTDSGSNNLQKEKAQSQADKLNSHPKIIPVSDCGNGWQALIDLLTQTIYDPNTESIDVQGWPLLISHITRGGRCPKPGFVEVLFDRMAAQTNVKKSLSAQISELMQSNLRNHHHNDPYAAICLAFNTMSHLPKKNVHQVPCLCKELTRAIKKDLPSSPRPSPTDSEKILELLLDTLDSHPNSVELITAMLQVQAFLQLSRPPDYERQGMPVFNIRKHDGNPHVEIKLNTSNGTCSLLLPFNPNHSFSIIENALSQNISAMPKDLIENLGSIWSLMVPQEAKGTLIPPIHLYQEHLHLDVTALANISERSLTANNSLLNSISFSVAAACLTNTPGLKNVEHSLLTHFPKAILGTQSAADRKSLVESLQRALSNKYSISCKSVIESAENVNKDLHKLQSSWITDLACSNHDELCSISCQLVTSYKFPSETYSTVGKSILPILIKYHPAQAVALLNHLLHSTSPDDNLENYLQLILEGTILKNEKHRIISVLPTIGTISIELIKRRCSTHPALSSKSVENLVNLFDSLLENKAVEEAVQLLQQLSMKGILSQSEQLRLWMKYCSSVTDQQGPLKGLLAWEEAWKYNKWNERNVPPQAQKILAELTSQLYSLNSTNPAGIEAKYFKQCLTLVRDPACAAEMQTLSAKHVERLLDGKDKVQALKEVYNVPSKYLNGDNNFSLKIKLIKIEIEQGKLPQASTSINELLTSTFPSESRPIIKAIAFELLDKLLLNQQPQQRAWNLNLAGKILINPHLVDLFEDDIDLYLSKLQQILMECCSGEPNNNRTTIYELLEKMLSVGFNNPKATPIPQTRYSISQTAIHVLNVVCPPKFSLPINLKGNLARSSPGIISALGQDYPAEKCIPFFKACHAHSMKPDLSEETLRNVLNNVAEYLIDQKATRQEVLDSNQFLGDYLKEDCIRQTLRTGLSIRLLSNLISSLLNHSCPQQAVRWINVLEKLSTAFSTTWHEKVPQKILEWAPALRREKEHKKCLELLLQIKETCPSKQSEIVIELFNLTDDYLLRKDMKACGNLLVDHARLLLKHVPESLIYERTETIVRALLKDAMISERVGIAAKILFQYPSLPAQIWTTALSHSAKLAEPSVLRDCWKAFFKATRNSSFLIKNKSELASCWLSAFDILEKIGGTEIMLVIEKHKELKQLFADDATPKQYEELLVKLFQIGLKLDQSPARNRFFQLKILPLRQESEELLKRPEASHARFAIDLSIVNALSQTDDYALYNHAYRTFVELITSSASNHVLEGLTNLFVGGRKFKEDTCPGIEMIISELQKDAINLHTVYNPLPIITTFKDHPTMDILDQAMTLILMHLDTDSERKNTIENQTQKSLVGLVDFFNLIIDTNHGSLIGKLSQCLTHEKSQQFLTEKDNLDLRRKVITRGLRNAIEHNQIQMLQYATEYFFRDFRYIAHDEEASQECIEVFLQCTMMMLCEHGIQALFKNSLHRFNSIIQRKDETTGQPNPFPLSSNRVAQIQIRVVETVLNQITRNPYVADQLYKYSVAGIEQFLQYYHKKSKLLVPLLHKYVFSSLPSIAQTYQTHIITCQHHVQQAMLSGMLNNNHHILFEFDFFLNLSPDNKLAMLEPNVQKQLVQNIFYTVCRHHSPESLWHLIESLGKLHTLHAFDTSPDAIVEIYRSIIITMIPFMYFNIGGMPLYEHLFKKILEDPRLTGNNKTPEWRKAALEVMTLMIQRMDALCQNPTARPKEIPSRFEPIDYLFSLFIRGSFSGCFDKELEGYLFLINMILPLIITKINNKETLLKYNTLVLKLLTMDVNKGAPRSSKETQLQAQVIATWIELLAPLPINGAKAEAAALFKKCDAELKLFKSATDAYQRAKAAIEKDEG